MLTGVKSRNCPADTAIGKLSGMEDGASESLASNRTSAAHATSPEGEATAFYPKLAGMTTSNCRAGRAHRILLALINTLWSTSNRWTRRPCWRVKGWAAR